MLFTPRPPSPPLFYAFADGRVSGTALTETLNAIYAKPQSGWSDDEKAVIASLQRATQPRGL